MKKRRLAIWMLVASMAFSLFPATAFAEPHGDGSGGRPGGSDDAGGSGRPGGSDDGGSGRPGGGKDEEQTAPVYSGTEITIPEELLDGNYTGTATVYDVDGDFTDYEITVIVTIEDGELVAVNSLGASSSDAAYANRAGQGISDQIASKVNGAGTYEIDVVSGATCSSTAIVQGINAALAEGKALSGTYYTMESEVVYYPSGSSFIVTVHNPEEGVDYDITLFYGVGKFSDDLEPKDDYCSVELISETDREKAYKVTMKPGAVYEIKDDDMTHTFYTNDPGTSLGVKVNNVNVGTFTLKSSAVPSITNNVLSLTGGNGETLTDYLRLINEVEVTYTDDKGEKVTTTYTTTWQHDMDPAFIGSDLFNADGSINFDLIAKVTEQGDDFEAVKDENGNNVTTDVPVFPYGANGDYTITVKAGDGYEAVTANVGVSYVAKNPETNDPDTGNPAVNNPDAGNPDTNNSDTNKTAANDTTKVTKTTAAKTSDDMNPFLWMVVAVVAGGGIFVTRKKILG